MEQARSSVAHCGEALKGGVALRVGVDGASDDGSEIIDAINERHCSSRDVHLLDCAIGVVDLIARDNGSEIVDVGWYVAEAFESSVLKDVARPGVFGASQLITSNDHAIVVDRCSGGLNRVWYLILVNVPLACLNPNESPVVELSALPTMTFDLLIPLRTVLLDPG